MRERCREWSGSERGFVLCLSMAAGLLALSLATVGCATDSPEATAPVSPTQIVSTVATATTTPTQTSVPTSTPVPSPTPTSEPLQLVILHTNDNWGETEPCG